MSKDTQLPGVKPRSVVPVLARDATRGTVLHTFDGSVRVEDIYVTLSGFRLLMLADRSIRPCRPEDVLYIVEDGAA